MFDYIERPMKTHRQCVCKGVMRAIKSTIAATGMAVALLFLASCSTSPESKPSSTAGSKPVHAVAAQAFGRLPLAFEENRGQTAGQVRYLARGPRQVLFLTDDGAVLSLKGSGADGNSAVPAQRRRSAGRVPPDTGANAAEANATLRLSLSGGRRVQPTPDALQSGRANYLAGNDPAKWTMDVRRYGQVRYHDVYPGIDLVYYGDQEQLEYDLVVAPGASPTPIRLDIEGARNAHIDASGNLVLNLGDREVVQRKPVVYQEIDGRRLGVEGSYRLSTKGSKDAPIEVAFALAEYDRTRALVIDPVLVYSTYLAGGQGDTVLALAVDAEGNLYAAGATLSANFPVVGGLPPDQGGSPPPDGDEALFISKLDPAGDALIYSTYLSATGNSQVYGLQVDGQGAAYVAGWTEATDFPVVGGLPPDEAGDPNNGGISAFISKLNPAGNALAYSTYLAAGFSENWALAVDGDGNAYVTGQTFPPYQFPVVGGLSAEQGGGMPNPNDTAATFIAKVNPTGDALVYSTYLSGNGSADTGYAIAVDTSGQAYVDVWANTVHLPIVGGLPSNQGGTPSSFNAAYLAKLNANGDTLLYSTYLDGTKSDFILALSVDSSGNLYVAGETGSPDFPVVGGLPLEQGGEFGDNGADHGFVAKVNPAGNALVYSTYISGNSLDRINALAIDDLGSVYVTGETDSTNFPQISGLPEDQGGLQGSGPFGAEVCAFVTKLNPSGSALVFSTYLCNNDVAYAMARDSNGNIYVAGNVGNDGSPFPILGGLPPGEGGSAPAGGGFITKLTEDAPLLSLERADFDALQSDGTIEINVVRSGSADDAATVDFATSDGTAIAGTDYVATNGTLNWAAGDSGPKAISIAILPDPAGNQLSFNLQLSNATGAVLGTPDVATITILLYSPPTVEKTFTPDTISAGDSSVLTITLTNSNNIAATLSSVLPDIFPSQLVVADPANGATTCPNGAVLGADPGSNAFGISPGAQIPPESSCTVTVSVTASVGGTYINTILIGALQTDLGNNRYRAMADLTVNGPPIPPTVAKAFTLDTIGAGTPSTLTITLGNANATGATLIAPLTDTLPPPVVVASPANATTTCAGGVLTADSGSGAVTLDASAAIPPTGTCTVTVSVTASAEGAYINTIPTGALQTDLGSNPDPATADLTVTAMPPTLGKVFAPDTIEAGAISTLTITLTNKNAVAATLTTALADAFPSPVVVANPPNASTTCADGNVTADAGAAAVTLSTAAEIPAAGSCVVTVSVTANAVGAYTNTIPANALETDFGSNADPASAVLTITQGTPPDRIFADGFDGASP